MYAHTYMYVYIYIYVQQLKELYDEFKITKCCVYLKQMSSS